MKVEDIPLNLEDTEMQADRSYYPVAAISCTVFLVSYKYVCPAISGAYFPSYNDLPKHKRVDWNTRVNSTVHAVMVSMLCLYCLMCDEEIHRDPVWADSVKVKYTCAIVLGYMVYDSIVLAVHYKAIGEIFYIFHHAASIYAYYYVITYSSLCWFANFRLIAEFSTPFVNQRWFLDVLGYPKTSFTFMLNGVAMALMFLMARIVVIPPYWSKVWSIYGTPASAKLGFIWFVLVSTSGVLDTINVFWMYKIYNGARKIIRQAFKDNSLNDKNKNYLGKVQ